MKNKHHDIIIIYEKKGAIMNIQEILDRVKQHQDINYKKFSEKIIKEKKLIGVRTSVLESISASIIKDDPLSYLDHYKKKLL